MKYTFEIEETLTRRITIERDTLDKALKEFYSKYENEEIVLDSSDFAGAKLSLIPDGSSACKIEKLGEPVEQQYDYAVVIDHW